MVPNNLCKHNGRTLLVANVSTERLGGLGILFYRNDLLGKLCTRYTVTPFHRKEQENFTEFAATTFGNVKLKPYHIHVFEFPVKNLPVLRLS